MNFPIAPFATQTRVRKIILFVCAAIYLCSAALGFVVGLKESRRPGGRLECPAVEEMHRLAYVLRRKPLASSPIHKPHSQVGSGTNTADRCATEAGQHHSASRPEDLGGAECPSRTVLGSHGDVRFGGSDHHCRLESVSGDLSQGL